MFDSAALPQGVTLQNNYIMDMDLYAKIFTNSLYYLVSNTRSLAKTNSDIPWWWNTIKAQNIFEHHVIKWLIVTKTGHKTACAWVTGSSVASNRNKL